MSERSSTGLSFRTPAEVRAIPNAQWEAWLRDDSLPFGKFAATAQVQTCLRTILKATQRRMSRV